MSRPFHLFNLFKNKRALSTAIATLMTLTATVVLSGGVVLYATNVSTSQMAREKLIMPSTHLWYINETSSVGGITITNTGTTDVIINKITVKGINCEWNASASSFILYNKTSGAFPCDLRFQDITSGTSTITLAGNPYVFEVATQGISLRSGASMALYLAVPINIMLYDMGQPIRVVITTTQSIYTAEANVESPT
jgi:hypothetical protein